MRMVGGRHRYRLRRYGLLDKLLFCDFSELNGKLNENVNQTLKKTLIGGSMVCNVKNVKERRENGSSKKKDDTHNIRRLGNR